jgi:hypothetical protein
MENEFGDRLIHFESHQSVSDPFTTAETTARANWYGVTGYPTVEIDGSREFIGADVCEVMTGEYRNALNARFAEVGNVSPVEITGSFAVSGSNIVYSATFRKVDNVSLTSLRATLLCYEDDIYWCCGYGNVSHWDRVVRDMYDQTITLTNVGDQVTVSQTIPIGSGWNTDNMVGIAYVQQTSGQTPIIQGYKMPRPYDFRVEFDNHVDSAPAGSGVATYTGRIVNTGVNGDQVTLTPPTGLGAWSSEIYVCGDPNPHTAPVAINLPANESCEISVRVHTDATKEVRTGLFQATSLGSGGLKTDNLKVFNGSYAVFLVNHNSNTSHYLIWTTALDQLGYLYDRWDIPYVHNGISPTWADAAGYDIMIWETGYRTSSFPGAGDQALMMQFVDAGGSLFFTSQGFLDAQNNVQSTFTQTYLGIGNWALNTGYTILNGVAGDPIGAGFTLPLSFQFPSFNKGDNPTPVTAVAGLLGDEGSRAVLHNVVGRGSKVVFMPACFNAVSQTDPDPNNQKVLLGKILTWLQPAPPADVNDLPGTLMASRIASVQPNPFNPRTEILYQLSPRGADGPVRLEIFDMAGRRVANMFQGRTTPGEHSVAWLGLNDFGKPVESGVYFARLTTVEGMQGSKLVLLK